jgi:hypothetical protein
MGSTGTIVLVIIVFLCLSLCAGGGWYLYQQYQLQHWKGSGTRLSAADMKAFLDGGGKANNVNCQNLSDKKLTYPDHQGLAELPDWAGFIKQSCATIPASFTSNTTLFSEYYGSTTMANQIANDPAMTESQQIDSTGNYYLANPVSKKTLKLNGSGVLTLTSNTSGTPRTIWSTPTSTANTYTLKFDSNTYNSGNLCVFQKNNPVPTWCMLPIVNVSTTASSTDGSSVNLQATQQAQLSAGNIKNDSDTARRFVMIDDAGNFCMYRGSPGGIIGSSIICK